MAEGAVPKAIGKKFAAFASELHYLAQRLDPDAPRPGLSSERVDLDAPDSIARMLSIFVHALSRTAAIHQQLFVIVTFEQLAYLSEIRAKQRRSRDFWRGEKSAAQAYHKMRRALRLLSPYRHGGYAIEFSLRKLARKPVVTFAARIRSDSGDLLAEPGYGAGGTFDFSPEYFLCRHSRLPSWRMFVAEQVGVAALRALLFGAPVPVLVGVSYRFEVPSGAYVAAVDWGDGSSLKHPRGGRLTHRFAKAGTFTIRVWQKAGSEPLVFPDAVIAIKPDPGIPITGRDLLEMFPFMGQIADELEE